MTLKSTVTTLAIIGALLGGTALAQDDVDRNEHHHYVKDSVITTKVKAKLASEHLSSLADIHVDTDADGVVFLSGTAPTRDAADEAVTLARSTDGVRGVKSHIKVKGE
jgi:hyperosmotically inducible protein